jgi:hypothetical protein
MKDTDILKFIRPANLDDILADLERTKQSRRSLVGCSGPKRQIKLKEEFLGPVPQWWMMKAVSQRSYRALYVGLLLWQQYWFQHQAQPVKLTKATLYKAGCKRDFVRRGLVALEKSGLISMQKFKHRSPLITITTQRKHG